MSVVRFIITSSACDDRPRLYEDSSFRSGGRKMNDVAVDEFNS